MNRIAISITMLIPPLLLLSLALAQPVSAAPLNDAAAVALPRGPLAIRGSEAALGECTGSACSAPRAGGGSARVPAPLRIAPLIVNVAPNGARVHITPGTLSVNVAPDAVRVNLGPDAARSNGTPGALSTNVAADTLHLNGTANAVRASVEPNSPAVNVAPNTLRINASTELHTSGRLRVDVAVEPLQVNVAAGALRVNVGPDALRVDLAPDMLGVNSAFATGSADDGQRQISAADAAPVATDIAGGDGTGSASSLPRIVGDLLPRLLELVRRAPLPLAR